MSPCSDFVYGPPLKKAPTEQPDRAASAGALPEMAGGAAVNADAAAAPAEGTAPSGHPLEKSDNTATSFADAVSAHGTDEEQEMELYSSFDKDV